MANNTMNKKVDVRAYVKNKIAQVGICKMFTALFVCSMFITMVLALDLTDHTIYNEETNTCSASNLDMNINIYPCSVQDIDGKDIVQYVDFEWTGASPQNTSWVFVYDGELEKGEIKVETNESYNVSVTTEQWVDDYLIDNVLSYDNLTGQNLSCDLGTQTNAQKFNVTYIDSNQSSEIICFDDVNTINATAFEISGWAMLPDSETRYRSVFVDYTSDISYLGNNLLGEGKYFYEVQDIAFQPNQEIKTKWTYTPQGSSKNGKWSIFGYPSSLSISEAVDQDLYIYLDPWWNSSWVYKKDVIITETSGTNLTNYSVLMNVSYESEMQVDFSDLRFVYDSSELDYYLDFKINSSWAKVYVKVPRLNASINTTIEMYYNNSGASSTSSEVGVDKAGMIIHYGLDETSGTVAIDSTGNNNGTNAGALINQNGKIGKAYNYTRDELDDTRSDSNTGINGTESWTMNAWFNSSYQVFVGQYLTIFSIGAVNANNLVGLMVDNDPADTMYISTYGGFADKEASAGVTIYNEWHMATMTYDGTNLRSYVDRVSIDNDTGTLTIVDSPFYLSNIGGVDAYYFGGLIDEASIWNRTLSTDEIDEIFNSNNGKIIYASSEPTVTFGTASVGNTAPTITANATSPATIYTNTDWIINLTATDPEEGYLDSYVQFYVNDSKVESEYIFNMTNNTNHLVATLGNGNFSKTNNLTAEVWVGDGTENTTKVNLTVVTVSNSAPVITTLQTTVSQNTSSTYIFDYNVTDADGDTITWYDNATLFNINSSTGIISDAPTENEAGNYSILITAGDGIINDTDSFLYTIVDTTNPVISNFEFIAINGSRVQIGADETAFNFTNLEAIEYMNITFTVSDAGGITDDIKLFFTANGTNACSLGNNQSTTCYNYDSDLWVEFANGTDTATFRDIGGASQGDSISCLYTGNSTERNYTCQLDEHYNPNVWKHYPLNFSDLKWQSGSTERITNNTIWKVELDTANIPLDANEYKLDFRVNASIGTTPTTPIFVHLCNSTYTTGVPELNQNCQLVGSKLPVNLLDDGTKFRGIFTSALTSSLGDIKYVLISSDAVASEYYSMKTFGKLGNSSVRTSVSNDDGSSYTNLSDGYETELNINWFYNGTGNNATQILFKIYSNDSLSNFANSSIQTMTWGAVSLNNPPIVQLISPKDLSNKTGVININWTTAEPNGDSYTTNITVNNGTTTLINSTLDSSISSVTFDTTILADGNYNLTVESCENDTTDLFCGNDTHLIAIDNTNPLINYTTGTDIDDANRSRSYIFVNVSVTEINEANITFNLYNSSGLVNSTTYYTSVREINWTSLPDEFYDYNVTVIDYAGNSNSTSTREIHLDNVAPTITIVNPVVEEDENTQPVNLIITTSEISTCQYSMDSGTRQSMGSGISFNSPITLSNGGHTVQFFCNDSSNNSVNSSRVFNVYIIIGGGGGGGGEVVVPEEPVVTDGIEIELYEIEVSVEKWFSGLSNEVSLLTKDKDGNFIDVETVKFEIVEDIKFTKEAKRMGIGDYEAIFLLLEPIERVTINITAQQGTKTKSVLKEVDVTDPKNLQKIIRNTQNLAEGSFEWFKENMLEVGFFFVLFLVAVVVFISSDKK